MKRLSVITFCLMATLSTFAYYSDYGYSSSNSEIPGWFTFMGIVMIVWGILEIILFFKIWGMTNNIKALKQEYVTDEKLDDDYALQSYLITNVILGNIEKAKKALILNFIKNVEANYTNKNGSIRPYVDSLKAQFEKIGEELPPYISKMETFGDYYNLFKASDFKIDNNK